ncbi:Nardilysin-like [Thalictrum thalictroides]|uniref:Nardilysin-like n=1 Tax=Thalictrum thalictroides TaxID=46969 RepID=A0A7J6WWM3_THATH|nr:Nardilysin-like [Thalictrum thalictroides]
MELLQVIKEEMVRDLRNANLNPLSHSSYLRMQLLVEVFWDVYDQLHCLVDLSYTDLKEFIPKLLLQLHIEGLCHGNLSKEEAINIVDLFKCNLSTKSLPMNLKHKERVLRLPSGANFVRDVRVKNKLEA